MWLHSSCALGPNSCAWSNGGNSGILKSLPYLETGSASPSPPLPASPGTGSSLQPLPFLFPLRNVSSIRMLSRRPPASVLGAPWVGGYPEAEGSPASRFTPEGAGYRKSAPYDWPATKVLPFALPFLWPRRVSYFLPPRPVETPWPPGGTALSLGAGPTARPLCGTVRLVAVVMPGYCTGGGYPESRASSGPRMVPPPTIGTPAPPCFFINPWLWNELPRAPLSGRALPGKADR